MTTNYFYEVYVKPHQKYEEEAAERIKNKFNVEILNFNDNNEYDFIDSNDNKYEVKYDGYSNISNNFFIVFLGYGKWNKCNTS